MIALNRDDCGTVSFRPLERRLRSTDGRPDRSVCSRLGRRWRWGGIDRDDADPVPEQKQIPLPFDHSKDMVELVFVA